MKNRIDLSFFINIPKAERRFTVPTFLTILRLLTAPVIIYAMLTLHWGIAFWLFIIGSFTDVADGYIARNFGQKTFLGACLDPIADKILVLSIYFTLAFVHSPLFSIPLWFVLLVLLKELMLIGGAVFLYLKQGFLDIKPTLLGKLTMAVQVLFIMWLFACYFFEWVPVKTYYTALGIVLIMVLSSLYQYIKIGLNKVRLYLN